ncbi:MAG: IS91 family transposase [Halanaerobiales bacterium]|nr:IS91 family transposase [Halanaerobiales bacterium]
MIEVADIFNEYGQEYRKNHSLPLQKLKAMSAIEDCRTAKLGGHVDECECGYRKISYNSCRNRHCPKCQALAREKWIESRKEELLPIQYFHVVFTIPDILNPLMLRNQKVLYSILFKASADTLTELSKDQKYLGAKIGFISVLHTWGQNLMDHPHIHSIVTGGGLSLDGQRWISCRKDFLIPVKVISKLFKGKFLDFLRKAYANDEIDFMGKIEYLNDESEFEKMMDSLYEKDWVVHCKPSFKTAMGVINYLGRYTNRVAISNYRIVKFADGKVTFKWKDYADKNKRKLMTLDAFEFIRRFLLHILPKGLVKIRYYGILSSRGRVTLLDKCKKLHGVEAEKTDDEPEESWEDILYKLTGVDWRICPCCGKNGLKRRGLSEAESRSKKAKFFAA